MNSKSGVVLIVTLSFLTAFLFLAGTVYMMVTLNTRQTGYSSAALRAFQQADAGVEYVESRLRADELNDAIDLTGKVSVVNYTAPSGFNFDPVTNVTRLANTRVYMFTVTGHDLQANATIQVVMGRSPDFFVGVFGDESLLLGPNTHIYSYHSTISTNPTSSTGEAAAASNGEVTAKATAIDGALLLGEDTDGDLASYSYEFSTSTYVVRTDRLDPDPLGAVGGELADTFAYVAVSNDNASAVGGSIVNGELRITGDTTLTAGSYYVGDIDIRSHETLTIDASAGPVKIYLTGEAYVSSQGAISVWPTKAESFQLYANSTETIEFQPGNAFTGFIYAPYAKISIKPNGSFYGALWGADLDVQPNGEFYVDMDFVQQFDADKPLVQLSWKLITD